MSPKDTYIMVHWILAITIVLGMALLAGLIWVAAHFIGKWW